MIYKNWRSWVCESKGVTTFILRRYLSFFPNIRIKECIKETKKIILIFRLDNNSPYSDVFVLKIEKSRPLSSK